MSEWEELIQWAKKNRPPGISIIWAFSGLRARGAQDYLFFEYEWRLWYAVQHWKKASEDCSLAIETKILNVCFQLVVHPAYRAISQWVLKSQRSYEQYWRLCDWSLFLPLFPSSAELQEMLVLYYSNTWMPWGMSSAMRAAHNGERDWDQQVVIWSSSLAAEVALTERPRAARYADIFCSIQKHCCNTVVFMLMFRM